MRSINIRAAKDYPIVAGQLHTNQLGGLNFLQDWLGSDKPYAILAGYAGTGKSYLTAAFTRLAQEVCWGPIGVTSPTHQARIELQKHLVLHGVNLKSEMLTISTIHSWLGLKEDITDDGMITFVPQGMDKSKYKDGCDILIVDESSMVDSLIGGYIDEAYRTFRGRVLFVGDPCQIPPVGETDSYPFLQYLAGDDKFFGAFFLTNIVRQMEGNPIIAMASELRGSIEAGVSLRRFPKLLEFVDGAKICHAQRIQDASCSTLFLSLDSIVDPRHTKALAYRNSTVDAMNLIVKAGRKGVAPQKLLPYYIGDTFILTQPLIEGNITILPNNSEVTVKSVEKGVEGEGEYRYTVYTLIVSSDIIPVGSTVTLKPEPKDPKYTELVELLLNYAKIQRKGSLERHTAWKEYYGFIRQYVPIKASFALTAHRSQGSTYRYAIIDETDIFSNRNPSERSRVAYTALTRASEGVIILR